MVKQEQIAISSKFILRFAYAILLLNFSHPPEMSEDLG